MMDEFDDQVSLNVGDYWAIAWRRRWAILGPFFSLFAGGWYGPQAGYFRQVTNLRP
jgi:hypothetical protein